MTDLEAEREQKQRDFDRKLLLAKSKIEMEEASVTVGPTGSAPGGQPSPPQQSGARGVNSQGWDSGDTGSISDSSTQGLCGWRQKHFPSPCLSFPSEN